jgi:DinB superfamily
MVFNSLGEILAFVEKEQNRFAESSSNLSEAQEIYRTASDRWSIAELAEHVGIVDDRVVQLTRKFLNENAPPSELPVFQPVSLDRLAPRWNENFTAPERVTPKGQIQVSESLARKKTTLETLLSLRPQIEALDCSQMMWPHPIFGDLNLYEWLLVSGMHNRRHREQVEAIKSSENFPS